MKLYGLSTPRDEAVYRNDFRRRRMIKLVELIDNVITLKKVCSILDVGGVYAYWDGLRPIWGDRNIRITLVNTYSVNIDDPVFTAIVGDARDLSVIPDNSFDIVHSNSVIEHVGTWNDKKRMAAEIRRLAPIHSIQTPNYWFPVEPHFRAPCIHWLPRPLQRRLVMSRSLGFYQQAKTIDEAYDTLTDSSLLDETEMQALFPDSKIVKERFLLFVKSIVAVRAPSLSRYWER